MTTEFRLKVMVVDDHRIVREGLEAMLSAEPDLEVVASVGSGREAIERCATDPPDVVLLDLRMPELDGLDVLQLIHARHPHLPILILSSADGDEAIFRAMQMGAAGYLLKSTSRVALAEAIRDARAGRVRPTEFVAQRLAERMLQTPLSAREIEILARIAQGESNPKIAATLDIAEATVKNHVHAILSKLGVTDRTQAVMIGLQRGIISLD